MTNRTRPPCVAIVGRPNVGKSSLLNRLAGRRLSIVDPMSGVTRDRVTAEIEIFDRRVELVDTGGIGIVDSMQLEDDVERQIETAMYDADLIVFVVDMRAGVTPLDEEVSRRLRRGGRPVLIVANKADTANMIEEGAGELNSLGFGEPLPVSAQHGRGIPELFGAILDRLPPASADEIVTGEDGIKLAFVGRQNVGKSSLLNRLAKAERVIVSEVAGTTRDAVDVRFSLGAHDYVAIDTAGMKRKGKAGSSVDFYSHVRTERSVRRCDVALLIIDATERLSVVDKNLASYIREQARPVIIVVNKWDLARDVTEPVKYEKYLRAHLRGLEFAPIAIISAKTGFNVAGLLDLARALYKQAGQRVTTADVNKVLEQSRERHLPRTKKSKSPKVFYGTQVDVHPPSFVLFVNDPSLFSDWFVRYFSNRFREAFAFEEVPLQISFRPRGGRGTVGRDPDAPRDLGAADEADDAVDDDLPDAAGW